MSTISKMYQQAKSLYDEHGSLASDQLPDLADLPKNFMEQGILATCNRHRDLDWDYPELDRHLTRLIVEKMLERKRPYQNPFASVPEKEEYELRYFFRQCHRFLGPVFREYFSELKQQAGGGFKRRRALAEIFYEIVHAQSPWAFSAALDELDVNKAELTALFLEPRVAHDRLGSSDSFPFEYDKDVAEARRDKISNELSDPKGYLRLVERVNKRRSSIEDIVFFRRFLRSFNWTDKQRSWMVENACLAEGGWLEVGGDFFSALGQLHDQNTFRPLDGQDGETDETLKSLKLLSEEVDVPDEARSGLGNESYELARQLLKERNEQRFRAWCRRGELRTWEYYHAAKLSTNDAEPLRMIDEQLELKNHDKALEKYLSGLANAPYTRLDRPMEGLEWLVDKGAKLRHEYTENCNRAVDAYYNNLQGSENTCPESFTKAVSALIENGARPPSSDMAKLYESPPYLARRYHRADIFDPLINYGIYPPKPTMDWLWTTHRELAQNLLKRLPERRRNAMEHQVRGST